MNKKILADRIGMATSRDSFPYIHKILSAEGKKVGYICKGIKTTSKKALKLELKKLGYKVSYFSLSFGIYEIEVKSI